MNPLRRLLGQTAVYGISSIVGRLLNYLLVPVYTRIFLPAEYGIVSEFYTYIGFLFIALTYGMETSFFRYAKKYNNLKKLYSTSIISLLSTSTIFIVFIILFHPFLSRILHYPQHTEYIIWSALIVAADAFLAIPFARLRYENRAGRFVFIRLTNIAVNIGLNLFFLVLCPYLTKQNPDSFINRIYDPQIRIGYIFISNLIASLVAGILLMPDILKVRLTIDFQLLKKMLRYGLPLLVAGLAGMINETIDRILLKYLVEMPQTLSLSFHVVLRHVPLLQEIPWQSLQQSLSMKYTMAQIGIYSANYKVAILMTLFIQAFRYGAEPFFFAEANKKDAKIMYAEIMKFFVLFCLIIFVGIMLYIDIIKHFIGSDYHAGIQVIPVLLWANVFLGIIYNLSVWYKLTDKTQYGALIAIFGASVTVIINVLLIPTMGYMASAWATLICYFSMAVISYFLGKKYYPIPYNLKRIFLYAVFAFVLYVISILEPATWGVFAYIFNTILFLAFVCAIVFNEGVFKMLKSMLLKRK